MPVAYSNLPIVKGTVRADTSGHCITDLDVLVTTAGWGGRTAVTGGFKYTVTSPQGFQAKVRIIDRSNYETPSDLGNFDSVVIQFMDMSESIKSFHNQIKTNGTFSGFQVIAGICQIFISVVGHNASEGGYGYSSAAGGIPARPNDTGPCNAGIGTVTVTDIWWTCYGSTFGFDFRGQLNCYAGMTYYINGVAVTATDNNNIRPYDGLLCLFPLTPTNTYSPYTTNYPAITYSAHTPLCTDAFIGWEYAIKGLLWDAFLQTNAQTLDSVDSFSDTDTDGNTVLISAQCWCSDFFSSLRLILGNPTADIGPGNVAY